MNLRLKAELVSSLSVFADRAVPLVFEWLKISSFLVVREVDLGLRNGLHVDLLEGTSVSLVHRGCNSL